MWIQGKGEHNHRLVNTDQVRYFAMYDYDKLLKAYDVKGSDIALMKFGEKSDGLSMISKIGRLIASGCKYLSLEDPENPVYGNEHDDPQQQY